MRVVGSDVRIERPAVHAHLFFAVSMSIDCVVAAYREELKNTGKTKRVYMHLRMCATLNMVHAKMQ